MASQLQPPRGSPPVINFGRLGKDPATRALAVQDIARACRDQGCFQVVNHGISISVMKEALEVALEFFALPKEHKEKFASLDIQQAIRYDTSSRDGISVARSFLKHYANPLEDWVQFWPVDPPAYRKKMGVYAVEIQRVSMQIMEAILQGLGLGPSYMQEKLENGVQFLALNKYPQFAHRGDDVGLGSHSDYGFITILLQSSPGLEVMHHDDVTWAAIPAISGALHVHVGDNLEVLSNGQLKSLVHRAILNPDEPRISIASIHGLSMDEKVRCAEELISEQHPEMYRGSSFQDFLDFLIGIPSNTSCAPSILTSSLASKVVVVGVAGAVDAAVGVPDAVVAVPFGLGGACLPFRAARSRPWLASTSPPVPSPGQPTTTRRGTAVRTGRRPRCCRARAGRAAPPDEACAVASAVVPCRASM